MPDSTVTLRNFSDNELIFDDDDTRAILKFFFPQLRQRIDDASITRAYRNFAQGLLVEAIDATYMLGYIEILFRTSYNPGAGMAKALKKLGRKAARHWFKHTSQDDLLAAKISHRVRDQLARSFKIIIEALLAGVASTTQTQRPRIASVHFGKPSKTDTLWG